MRPPSRLSRYKGSAVQPGPLPGTPRNLMVPYYDALVRMFEQALKVSVTLAAERRDALLGRLGAVRDTSHNVGCGVGDDMDDLLARYGQR